MASGKSSIGRQVAELLAVPFVDTDVEIVAKYGPIAELFETRGEAAFREIEEQEVLRAIHDADLKVVALGGGAILSEQTRAALSACTVILLMTDEATVLARANLDKRPLLRDDPSAWSRILNERMPYYQQVASVTFDVSKLPKEVSAEKIAAWLREEDVA
jgi:shikimate kinase